MKTKVRLKLMSSVLFVILQCTWGIVQTLLGLIVYIIFNKSPHEIYRGCIDSRWEKSSGLSLGLFIFTPNEKIRTHEYGHSMQSAVLGPFYLVIGLISFIWANAPYFVNLRKERKIPYDACFVEAWASKWGEKSILKETVNRIKKMEACFDNLQKNVTDDELQILEEYYKSGQWLKDYEMDEQGLIPKDLKRGVLSQDAVYNFLEEIKAMNR